MRLVRRSKQLRSLRLRGERGSTMIAVIGITVVTAVVAVGITGVTMGALATTGNSRSAIQAQAAADSGIAAAVAKLNTEACAPRYSRSSTPAYSVEVFWSATATAGFTSGCPTGTDTSYLKLVSTGSSLTAASGGLGAHRYVEAIYQYSPTVIEPEAPVGVSPSGAALYSYSTSSFGMTGLTLVQAGSARPTVILRSGDFVCNSSSVINGDVIAANGKMRIDNCVINGNAASSSSFELAGSGKINGDVNASGVTSGYSVLMTSPSSSITGTVWAAGPGKIHIPIGGDYVAAGASNGKSIFQSSSHVSGAIRVSGDIQAAWVTACGGYSDSNAIAKCALQQSPKHVDGTIDYKVSGLTAPVVPIAPDWVDYNYSPDDWPGYDVITLTSSQCDWSWAASPGLAKLLQAANSTTPTIIDGRACNSIAMWYTANPALKSDLVIIAKSFNVGSNNFTGYNNEPRKMWMITPDTVADGKPTCSTGDMQINGDFKVSGSLSAMAYSPCTISLSSTTWRGQMYAGYVKMNSNQTVNYDPLGLPGVDLDTGDPSGSGSGGSGAPSTDGTGVVSLPAISYRDVSSAG